MIEREGNKRAERIRKRRMRRGGWWGREMNGGERGRERMERWGWWEGKEGWKEGDGEGKEGWREEDGREGKDGWRKGGDGEGKELRKTTLPLK